MKGENHGVPFNRCDLCGEPAAYGESHCNNCKTSCLKDASELLDKLVITYDTDLAYECMTRILEGRQ